MQKDLTLTGVRDRRRGLLTGLVLRQRFFDIGHFAANESFGPQNFCFGVSITSPLWSSASADLKLLVLHWNRGGSGLEERYQDHAGYVAAVRKAVATATTAGFLLKADADTLLAQAEASNALR